MSDTPKTVNVNIPSWFSARVREPHEFKDLKHYLELYLGLKFEYEQVGCFGEYEAIFYIGEKPQSVIDEAKKTYEEE